MRVFLILLLVSTVPGFCQTPRPRKQAPAKIATVAKTEKTASPAHAWPIGTLRVEGNRIYTSEQILAAAGLKVGQTAGKDEFEAARDRLLATGAFESVGYKFGPAETGSAQTAASAQYAASFQVIEIAQVFPYRFDSLPVDSGALRNWLLQKEPLFNKTIPGTQVVLSRIAKETEEFLAKSGHPENVAGKLTAEGPKEMNVIFGPTSLSSVAEVKFTGNETITNETLQSAIAGVAVGAIYSEPRFRQLLETSIRPVYEAKGKIRVAFPKLDTAPAKDVNGLVVTVKVVEGPTFNLGEVTMTGAPGSAALVKEGKFKLGEPANFTQIEEDTERIRAIIRRRGYMQVKSEAERKINDKDKKVDLIVHMEQGPLFSFGELKIEGLDIQSEPQVRKLWSLKSGAPFNTEYPAFFLARVREDGYFDNLGKTRSKIDVNDKDKIVDVTLVFSSDGKPLPAIGPARDSQDRRRRPEEQQEPPR